MFCGLELCSTRKRVMGRSADPVDSYCHAAIHNTVSGRQVSRRDTFFGYVHKRLPNGARIGRLGFPEQALVHQCLDDPIRYFGVGQDEATTLALAVPALALCGGAGCLRQQCHISYIAPRIPNSLHRSAKAASRPARYCRSSRRESRRGKFG